MFTNHAHKGEQRPGDYERTVEMLMRSGEENQKLRRALELLRDEMIEKSVQDDTDFDWLSWCDDMTDFIVAKLHETETGK